MQLRVRSGFLLKTKFGWCRTRGKDVMEDFPIWLKLLVWLVISGTVLYAIVAAILSALNG